MLTATFLAKEGFKSAVKGSGISNYGGGENPLLQFLFFAALFLALLSIGIFALWEIYKRIKFNGLCKDAGLSGEEIGVLKSFLRRFKVKEPLLAIMRRKNFDDFSAKVAHHFGNSEISEEDLLYEVAIFNSIREKLGLQHNFRTKNLTSSRALPEDLPLIITYFDKTTNNKLEFSCNVYKNSDLFLGVSPPQDEELIQHLRETRKPQLEVTFVRERDADYHFDSTVYKYLSSPEEYFLLQHSTNLTQGQLHKPMNLPATVIYHTKDSVEEYEAIIDHLDSKHCAFYLDNQKVKLHKTSSALINTTIKDQTLAIQASITKLVRRGDKILHRAELKNLNEDTCKLLLQFAFEKTSSKKSKQE